MIFTSSDAIGVADIQETLRKLGLAAGERGTSAPRPEALAAFCEKWKVSGMWLFGSAARGDAGPDSDIDVLVSFRAGARTTLFDLADMEEELKALFGCDVDLVDRVSVERSENLIRRNEILREARPLYDAKA
ncbi:MAG: nucleotidyltransferase family protein [Gemmatimonadota bacterium]